VFISDPLETLPENPAGVRALHLPTRTRLRVGGSLLEPFVVADVFRASLPAPEHVPTLIPENLEEPRPEGPLHVEPGEVLPRLHEGFLKRVVCGVVVAHHPHRDAHARSLVGPHERLEEASVARSALSNQLSLHFGRQLRASVRVCGEYVALSGFLHGVGVPPLERFERCHASDTSRASLSVARSISSSVL